VADTTTKEVIAGAATIVGAGLLGGAAWLWSYKHPASGVKWTPPEVEDNLLPRAGKWNRLARIGELDGQYRDMELEYQSMRFGGGATFKDGMTFPEAVNFDPGAWNNPFKLWTTDMEKTMNATAQRNILSWPSGYTQNQFSADMKQSMQEWFFGAKELTEEQNMALQLATPSAKWSSGEMSQESGRWNEHGKWTVDWPRIVSDESDVDRVYLRHMFEVLADGREALNRVKMAELKVAKDKLGDAAPVREDSVMTTVSRFNADNTYNTLRGVAPRAESAYSGNSTPRRLSGERSLKPDPDAAHGQVGANATQVGETAGDSAARSAAQVQQAASTGNDVRDASRLMEETSDAGGLLEEDVIPRLI